MYGILHHLWAAPLPEGWTQVIFHVLLSSSHKSTQAKVRLHRTLNRVLMNKIYHDSKKSLLQMQLLKRGVIVQMLHKFIQKNPVFVVQLTQTTKENIWLGKQILACLWSIMPGELLNVFLKEPEWPFLRMSLRYFSIPDVKKALRIDLTSELFSEL